MTVIVDPSASVLDTFSETTGRVDGDWTKTLHEPDGTVSSNTITVTEIGTTGFYKVEFTIDADLGLWSLDVTLTADTNIKFQEGYNAKWTTRNLTVIRSGSATSAGSAVNFPDTAYSGTDPFEFHNHTIKFTSGTHNGVERTMLAVTLEGGVDQFVFKPALPSAVASGVTYEIYEEKIDDLDILWQSVATSTSPTDRYLIDTAISGLGDIDGLRLSIMNVGQFGREFRINETDGDNIIFDRWNSVQIPIGAPYVVYRNYSPNPFAQDSTKVATLGDDDEIDFNGFFKNNNSSSAYIGMTVGWWTGDNVGHVRTIISESGGIWTVDSDWDRSPAVGDICFVMTGYMRPALTTEIGTVDSNVDLLVARSAHEYLDRDVAYEFPVDWYDANTLTITTNAAGAIPIDNPNAVIGAACILEMTWAVGIGNKYGKMMMRVKSVDAANDRLTFDNTVDIFNFGAASGATISLMAKPSTDYRRVLTFKNFMALK